MSDATVFEDRLMTCVAHSDWHNEALWGEAVVMIGENPERRATWIAVKSVYINHINIQEDRLLLLTEFPDGCRTSENNCGIPTILS